MRGSVALTLLLVLCTSLSAQAPAGSPGGPTVSLFLGGGWTQLSGGISEGGTLQPGPIGVGVDGGLARLWSWRGEILAQNIGARITERGDLSREGRISRGQAGLAGMLRIHPIGRAPDAFVGLGSSLVVQTYCDVDLIGGGFLGGETIGCEEWQDVELRPKRASGSAIFAIGLARGRLAAELRYDHGLQAVIATPEGDMRARSLAAVGHYRFGSRLSPPRAARQPRKLRPGAAS